MATGEVLVVEGEVEACFWVLAAAAAAAEDEEAVEVAKLHH